MMEDYKMPLNFFSSLVLSGAFTAFLIFVFGREESKINKMSFFGKIIPKIALAFCTAGALMNALTFSDPPWSEVILNAGLALLFTWAAWFHWKFFVCVKEEVVLVKTSRKKKTKYK